jgi:hypothetical protein
MVSKEDSMSGYGIIAYIPRPGVPEDDEAHFDGWHADLEEAHAIFDDFVKRYPRGLVHLVSRVESEWRDMRDTAGHCPDL